jgi:hypothetical protein
MMVEVRCSGNVPRCAPCQLYALDCQYEPAQQDRLKEFVYVTLLHLFAYQSSSGSQISTIHLLLFSGI